MQPKRNVSGVQHGKGAVADIGEGNMFQKLCDVVDSAESDMLHEKAARMPHLHAVLWGHHEGMFACASDVGTGQKERDWLTFCNCHLVYGSKIPRVGQHIMAAKARRMAGVLVGGPFKGLFTSLLGWVANICCRALFWRQAQPGR